MAETLKQTETAPAKAAVPEKKEIAALAPEHDYAAELQRLEVEAKRLEIQEKRANLEDLNERLDERKMRREEVRQKAYTNGNTLRDIRTREAAIQKRCNHRKGGNGALGIQLGQGDNPQHAVIKHTMLTGDMWIRCQRCGKTWSPPLEVDYKPGGQFESLGQTGYLTAFADYQAARNFQTNNTPSSSQQYQWSDGGQFARETLRYTTLR